MAEIFRGLAVILFGVRDRPRKDYTVKIPSWKDLGSWYKH